MDVVLGIRDVVHIFEAAHQSCVNILTRRTRSNGVSL